MRMHACGFVCVKMYFMHWNVVIIFIYRRQEDYQAKVFCQQTKGSGSWIIHLFKSSIFNFHNLSYFFQGRYMTISFTFVTRCQYYLPLSCLRGQREGSLRKINLNFDEFIYMYIAYKHHGIFLHKTDFITCIL